MPELPEVETIARELRALLTGARIVGAACDWPAVLRSHEPQAFREAVSGRLIEGLGRRGKQLLIWLGPAGQGGRDAAPAVLTVHLKMSGQLFVVPADRPKDRHVHVTLSLADGRELRFRDVRKFGRVGLYRRDPDSGEPAGGEARGVLPSGAEPLAEAFTARRLRELIARRRGRLKTLLMNQDFLAGVGNIYADESLWRARLHPLRDAASLKPEEVGRLHGALREVLAEAIERRGSSVDDYTAPEGDGTMQEHLAVYQRTGQPCPRCGRVIRRIVLGGRSAHFCGWCQRLPASQREAAASLLEAARSSRRRGPAESAASRVEAVRRAAAARRAAARAGGRG
jgi:formamidopyrimidine-DNA glycosylase